MKYITLIREGFEVQCGTKEQESYVSSHFRFIHFTNSEEINSSLYLRLSFSITRFSSNYFIYSVFLIRNISNLTMHFQFTSSTPSYYLPVFEWSLVSSSSLVKISPILTTHFVNAEVLSVEESWTPLESYLREFSVRMRYVPIILARKQYVGPKNPLYHLLMQ